MQVKSSWALLMGERPTSSEVPANTSIMYILLVMTDVCPRLSEVILQMLEACMLGCHQIDDSPFSHRTGVKEFGNSSPLERSITWRPA